MAIFTPPPGWVSQAPPPQAQSIGVVAVYQPRKANGPNIVLMIHPRQQSQSLDQTVAAIVQDETGDGRTFVAERPHASCSGKVAGKDVDFRYGSIAAQYYHVAVKGKTVYALIYTHAPNEPVDSAIMHAFDSFCPP